MTTNQPVGPVIRCLIADDELIAHQILEQYILQTPGLMLVAKCRNALEAFAKLEQHTIDLIFLDIEMPLVNGITFLKTLTNPPKVIFTTAYANYALDGYDLNVTDYLLKPFSYERFVKAVEKVKQALQPTPIPIATEQEANNFLLIKEKEGLMKIAYDDILYIEASRDYMKIFTMSGQHLLHLTMKKLEELLPGDRFIRTHKSFIVALRQIKLLKVDAVILMNKTEIPVSINYADQVKEKFIRT
ncbi:LytTR family DNA-binding domain-containing protein [Paraflavitalea speifideaquila]|uniref:LytR/AlgR family response regulator transcription factor n=1 Tax=Paraflavitalea speifideaquila TaxID=3076558 RepID=UPI0028E47744|nr:LytTR family DNA-binding domain-containing protein [Paraflavitalea speifideiaquila]